LPTPENEKYAKIRITLEKQLCIGVSIGFLPSHPVQEDVLGSLFFGFLEILPKTVSKFLLTLKNLTCLLENDANYEKSMTNCPFSVYLGPEKMCEILYYTLDSS
jgi:hypothetical protein